MGLAAVAGHLILLLALASAGTVLVGAVTNSISGQLDAQNDALHRLRAAGNAEFALASSSYNQGQDILTVEWTNDGGDEVPLDEVTLLVNGVVTDTDTVELFQVQGSPGSNLWMPGETLEVQVEGQGDADLSIVGPYGTTSHRRA